MVIKTRPILSLLVFVHVFGLDRVQNTIVVYSVLKNLPIETFLLRNSWILYERKTKDCARSWTIQHKSWHFLFAPLMFAGLHNHFPILTLFQCRMKTNYHDQ